MRIFVLFLFSLTALADCVPPLDNAVTPPEFQYCPTSSEKNQFEPVPLQETIFEKREEELFVTGQAPYVANHKEIKEEESR